MLIIAMSIITQTLLIKSITSKNRKDSLSIQALSCVSEAAYCFLAGAITGGILSTLCIFRSILFANSKKIKPRTYKNLLFVFYAIVIVNCFITWSGPISILPTIGSLFRTYALWQPKMSINRLSGITTAFTYGIYFATYGGWIMVLGDIFLFAFSAHAFYKKDLKTRSLKTRFQSIFSSAE